MENSIERLVQRLHGIQENLPMNDLQATAEHLAAATEALTINGEGMLDSIAQAETALGIASSALKTAVDSLRKGDETITAYVDTIVTSSSPGPAPPGAQATDSTAHTPREIPAAHPSAESCQRQAHPRKVYLGTQGFSLFTDTNDKLMHTLSVTPVQKNTPYLAQKAVLADKLIEDAPAGTSLYVAMRSLVRLLPANDGDFYSVFDITPGDRRITSANTTFQGGFADMDFPWHFSAGVANAVAHFFVEKNIITEAQLNSFTLHDWANIIGTGWFSRLMHSLALTANGMYTSFGESHHAYGPDAFSNKMEGLFVTEPRDPLFQYKTQIAPQEGLAYATAILNPNVTKALRVRMRQKGDSIGCPVARYSVQLPEHLVKDDPHVRNLIAGGTLTVVPERSGDGKVRLTQEWSAIDKVLSLFAAQLDRYQWAYGTPRVSAQPDRDGKNKITHRPQQPVDALRWPAGAIPPQA